MLAFMDWDQGLAPPNWSKTNHVALKSCSPKWKSSAGLTTITAEGSSKEILLEKMSSKLIDHPFSPKPPSWVTIFQDQFSTLTAHHTKPQNTSLASKTVAIASPKIREVAGVDEVEAPIMTVNLAPGIVNSMEKDQITAPPDAQ